ncbi:hypothetical protein V4890_24175, partial [Ralstonia solanacearum species complex bacterium KE056]|uniref:hypothetical protein n=1 Tax=Ralstonia solanacearum species complex bacterium KE056 TaxID=3119585 RepID=UPI002FC3BD26
QGLAQLDVVRLRVVDGVLVQDQLLLIVRRQVGLAVVGQAVDEVLSLISTGAHTNGKPIFLKSYPG